MIDVNNDVKTFFNQDALGTFRFQIDSDEYTSSHIQSGSLQIIESLFDGDEIDFFAVNKSELNVVLGNLNQDINDLLGKEISFTEDVSVDSVNYEEIPLGVYTIVESTNEGDYMIGIKAYDNLHKFDVDVSDWWNTQVTFPITVRNLLISLCTYCGVTYSFPNSFTNSAFSVTKNVSFGYITGLEMLGYIQQATASFIKADRYGVIKMVELPTTEDEPCLEYTTSKIISTEIADYEVLNITGVNIRSDENDIGVLAGTNTNVYVIQNNPFFYEFTGSADDIQVANNILTAIEDISYIPFTGEFKGIHYIECGDLIKIHTYKNKIVSAPLFHRELHGIGLFRDTFTVNGLEYHETIETFDTSIRVLNRKSHEFTVTVEELRSDITEIDEDMGTMNSLIEQNSQEISTKVSETVFNENNEIIDNQFSEINQTVSYINSTVNDMHASLNDNGLQIFNESVGDTVTTITGDGMKVNVLDGVTDGIPTLGDELLNATSEGVNATRLTADEYFKLDTANVSLQMSTFYNSVHSKYQVGLFVLKKS